MKFLSKIVLTMCLVLVLGFPIVSTTSGNQNTNIPNLKQGESRIQLSDYADFVSTNVEAPYPSRLSFSYFSSADDPISAFVDREVDYLESKFRWWDTTDIANDVETEIFDVNLTSFGYLTINCARYPFSIKEFRQAIAYAMDKYDFSQVVHSPELDPLDSLVLPSQGVWHNSQVEGQYYLQDLNAAVSILEAAGFIDIDSDDWREAPNGQDFEFRLMVPGWNEGLITAMEELSQSLRSIGIPSSIVPTWIDHPTPYLVTVYNSGDYDAAWWGYYTNSTPLHLYELFHSSMEPWVKGLNLVHGNPSRFQSVEVDTLLETMKYSTDFEDSLSACWEVQEVLADECPMIPIYDGINYKLARTDVWEPPFHGVSPETTDYWTVNNARLREYDGGPFGGNFRSEVNLASSLSPALGTTSSRIMLRFLYPGLGQRGHDLGEVKPSKLVETWIVESTLTGQNIVFHLSEKAMWSDGIPLTAADVAFSYDSLRQTSSRAYPVLELISNIEIISDHAIRVEIDSPSYFAFQDLTLVPIIPRHICEGNDDYWEHLQHNTVTAGDFVCESTRLEYDPGGPLEVSVTGLDLASLGIPEVGDFIVPESGEYLLAIDYISGLVPIEYVITAEVDGIEVEQIFGSINPDDDNIVPEWHNFESWAVEDIEPLYLTQGDHVTLTLEFASQGSLEPDLDLVCWASHESGFWRVEEATLVQRSIAGTVIKENSNEPIPDAELTLRDAATEEIVAATMTDEHGLYKFSNLVVGDYWIELIAGIGFSVTGSYRQRATIGDVVNFALQPRNFKLELSGSFDYLLKEEIYFQFAGQLKDIDTGVPISGAYVEFDLYGPDGLLILSDAMVEQSPGTYVYTSADTLKDLKWEKGIYLVICDASLRAGAEICATSMMQFHIDPPSEPDLITSSVLPSIGAISIISVAGIGGLFRRHRRLRNRSP